MALLPKILQATKGWNVLTVGDVDGFARDGGTINLVNEEQRVVMEINMEAAQRSRLKIKLEAPRAGEDRHAGTEVEGMLRAFRDAPLKRKLMIVVMIASGTVVVVASLAMAIGEVISYRKSLRSEISILGEIVGANTAAAVTFNDRKAAEETLSALRAHPHILSAYVLSADDRVFVRYTARNAGGGRPEDTRETLSPTMEETGSGREGTFDLRAVVPIFLDGQKVSTVIITADMKETFGHG